jgi:hypothetical protein
MLYKVEARTPQGDLLTLQFDDITDGFIVEEIGGLDPVNATLVSTSFAQQDGSHYQSARRENRNITLKIQMEPTGDDSVEDLRNRLYGYFMTKNEVNLRFFSTNGLTVDIDGRVESFVAPLFVQEPEANISIINFDPDFIALAPTVISGFSTADVAASNVDYEGSVDTGMVFVVHAAHVISDVTIYQTTPSGQLYSLEFSGDLISGDTLTISTVDGSKSATLTRAGVVTSVLYGISPQSKWLQLENGTNAIQIYATDAGSSATITYTGRYGGL